MAIFDNRYEQEKLLGQGAFSEVWKVRDTQTEVTLALKIYNPTGGIDANGNEILTHEFALMVNANHKNLLRPLFFATCDNRPYLILPYCKQGNIGKMIGKMTEEEAWKLIRDCASALAYLHNMTPPILHQDIKPANILMNDNGDYMLTDFGVSTQAKQSLSRVSNQEKDLLSAGTISYMAPERFSKQNLPIMANDIYSLGSTVYEMLSGMLPFGNDGGLLQKKGAEVPELPGNYSPLLKRTLEKCLAAEPWARPTASRLEDIANEALKHPETRQRIPDIFNATSQSEVPQSQINATQPNTKATVMGPLPEMPINKGTVMGPALPTEASIHGTVIGSSKQYNSGEPYAPEDQYANQTVYNSKKGIWIAVVVAAILAVGAAVFFAMDSLSESQEKTEMAISPEEQQRIQDEEEFKSALELFNNESPDSVKTAFNRMLILANKGHKEAIYAMAYTYAKIPNDTESDRRKRLLGLAFINGPRGGEPVSDEVNRKAIEWLEKAISSQVPNYHRCLYWLASYYYKGVGTKEDISKTKNLLLQAKEEADKNQDFVYQDKIEKTLKELQNSTE